MYRRKQFTQSEREEIYRRDHYRCCKCNKNLINHPELRVIDHILPLSKGGSNEKENLQLLCDECDKKKKDTIPVECQDQYIKIRLEQLTRDQEKRKKRFFKH